MQEAVSQHLFVWRNLAHANMMLAQEAMITDLDSCCPPKAFLQGRSTRLLVSLSLRYCPPASRSEAICRIFTAQSCISHTWLPVDSQITGSIDPPMCRSRPLTAGKCSVSWYSTWTQVASALVRSFRISRCNRRPPSQGRCACSSIRSCTIRLHHPCIESQKPTKSNIQPCLSMTIAGQSSSMKSLLPRNGHQAGRSALI